MSLRGVREAIRPPLEGRRSGEIRPRRFPFLLYRRLARMYRGPALLTALLALGLYYLPLFRPVEYPWPPEQDFLLLIMVGAVLGVWLIPEIGSRLSGVEPRPEALVFRAPFFALRISYRRIRNTRPTVFSELFPQIPRRHRRWVEPFYDHAVLVIETAGYPLPARWIRWLLGPYVCLPQGTGFVCLVSDWMALSRAIDYYREAVRGASPRGS
ncbi:hypothetical protein [Thermoflexus sp.]|uniref:hypothetical protein n=2 Tax=Thermoflexus sp. TaxID=1969742 RepID=UPI0025DE544D|nr:hypothetical protein [Thermoflexus sp.]MCS6963927.1 hypothetical protein [Thermoflexus sp.]MCX7690680.1 hypothetical protein [Thermoflexus sp.]MDW8184019.1 hypothetical protein [Anaerolineae bacterium]